MTDIAFKLLKMKVDWKARRSKSVPQSRSVREENVNIKLVVTSSNFK